MDNEAMLAAGDTAPIWTSAYTQKGLALMAKLHAGAKLQITRVLPGAGHVAADTLPIQQGVAEPRKAFTIGEAAARPDGLARLPVQLTNAGVAAGFSLWQVGVYAADPDEGEILYCIMQSTAPDYIPTEAQMPGFMVNFGINLIFGNAQSLHVTIDPEGLVANETLEGRLKPLEPYALLTTITHGLGCYPIATVAPLKWGAGMGGAGEAPAGGTPPKSVPVQCEWPSSNAVTLYVPMDVARLGANLEIHQIDSHQYTVTWADNATDGLYIELLEDVDMPRRHDADMAAIRSQLADKAAQSDLQAASGDISDILDRLEGMANVTDLEELRRLVAAKAAQSDLQATNQAVATKASQSDLQAVRNTLAAKANQTDLQATNQAVAAKASQTDLQAVRNALAAKAAQSDLQATNQVVAAKADKTELNNYARVSSGVWTPVMYARLEPAGAPAVETVMPAQTNGVWHRVGRLVIAYFDVTLGNINGIQGAALMRGMPFERAGAAKSITLYGGLTHYSGWQSNNNMVGDGIPQVGFNPTSVTIAQFGLLLANGDLAMQQAQNLFTSNAKMSGCLIYITP